jgi:hypothetical protein
MLGFLLCWLNPMQAQGGVMIVLWLRRATQQRAHNTHNRSVIENRARPIKAVSSPLPNNKKSGILLLSYTEPAT